MARREINSRKNTGSRRLVVGYEFEGSGQRGAIGSAVSNFEQLGRSARVIVGANKRPKRRTLHDHVSHLGSSIRRGPRWVHLRWNRLRTNAVIVTGAKFITDDRPTVNRRRTENRIFHGGRRREVDCGRVGCREGKMVQGERQMGCVRAAGHRPKAFGSDQLGVHLQMLVLNPEIALTIAR
jgi:hypothetical protein